MFGLLESFGLRRAFELFGLFGFFSIGLFGLFGKTACGYFPTFPQLQLA